MECKVCEQLKTKLYCQKCVKDGVRLQNHQLLAVARKKDEAFDKVKEFLNTDVSRRICQAHAERDEKKYVIKAARQEIERIQGVIRKERQRLENIKGDVATRKSNLASGMKGIRGGFNANATSLKTETGRVKDKRETVHQNIAIARRSRVREAAELLGLRKLLGKEDSYVIAGILIVDLHLIRNYAPIYLVLGISHVTHLLTLISDYLYLKLPHEIIAPSRGNAYTSIRKSPTTKPIPITIPIDPSTENPSKAWQGRKLKDMPNVDSLVEAFALVAWDIAWVLWTQQLWPPPPGKPPGNEPLEACHLARNLVAIVSSPRIGRISHGSTMEFVPVMENLGKLPTFGLSVRGIQEAITGALEDGCAGVAGDGEGGGWDIVEGGEEVMRADDLQGASDKIEDLAKCCCYIPLRILHTAPSLDMTAHSNSNDGLRARSRSQSESWHGASKLEYFSKWDDGFIKEYENVASKPLISFMEHKCSAFSIIPIHAGHGGNAIFPVILVVAKDFSNEDARELNELFTTLRCNIIQRIFCFDAEEDDWIAGRSERYDEDDDDEMPFQSRSFKHSPLPGEPLGFDNEEHISTLGVYVKIGGKKDAYAITTGNIDPGDAFDVISPTVVYQPPALDIAYQREVLLRKLKACPSGDKVAKLLQQVSVLDSLKPRFGEVWFSKNEVSNVGDHKFNVNYSLIKVDESRMSSHLVPIPEDNEVKFPGVCCQSWSTGFTPSFPRGGGEGFALRSSAGRRGTMVEHYTHVKMPWSPVTTSEYTIYGIHGEPFSHRADCGTPVLDGEGKCFGLISGQVSGVPKKDLLNHGALSPISVSYITPISAILYHIRDGTGSEVTMLVDPLELVDKV